MKWLGGSNKPVSSPPDEETMQNHKGAIYPINVTNTIKWNGFIFNPEINFKLVAYQFCSAQASSNSSALFMRERDSALVS